MSTEPEFTDQQVDAVWTEIEQRARTDGFMLRQAAYCVLRACAERDAALTRVRELEAENAKLKEALKIAGVWDAPMGRVAENERLRVAFDAWVSRDWECYMHAPDEACSDCDGSRIAAALREAMEDKGDE